MKKTYFAILGAAAILSLATACSSKNVNEPTANESSQSASSESSSNGMDESSPMDDLKEDAKDAVLPSEGTADAKQSTLTGTISDIKDFMFTITADGTDYEFSFEQDQKPDGLSDVKDGDKVTVTYTGTVSEVDAFSGTVLSVKKAEYGLLTHFIPVFFMAVLTDEARKISALPAQAAIFDPLNIKHTYQDHGIHVPRSYFVHTSLKNLLHN